jgi:hypothetical protein
MIRRLLRLDLLVGPSEVARLWIATEGDTLCHGGRRLPEIELAVLVCDEAEIM